MHYDCNLFWTDPLAYFSTHDFPYMFIASTELGLLGLFLPICTAVTIRLDQIRACKKLSDYHRQCVRCIFRALIPLILAMFCIISFSLCVMPNKGSTSWQTIGMRYAYSWRASNSMFWVFVLECIGRLSLSTIIWVTVCYALSLMIQQKEFLVLAIIAVNQGGKWILEKANAYYWELDYLQIPQIGNKMPLSALLWRQLSYFFSAVIFFHFIYTLLKPSLWTQRFKLKKRLKGVLVKNIDEVASKGTDSTILYYLRSCQTFGMWLAVVALPLVYLLLKDSIQSNSVDEYLLLAFSGFPWGNPVILLTDLLRWLMLFLPPFIGMISLSKAFLRQKSRPICGYGTKEIIKLHVASLIYTLSCIVSMWIIVIGYGLIKGANFVPFTIEFVNGQNLSISEALAA